MLLYHLFSLFFKALEFYHISVDWRRPFKSGSVLCVVQWSGERGRERKKVNGENLGRGYHCEDQGWMKNQDSELRDWDR